jgi:hypothetical protein
MSGGTATATALINAVTGATNPTLKTTNVETLKKIQAEVARMNLLNSSLYSAPNNDIGTLVTNANAYNDNELTAVNAANATLGWNAATQRESTVLYMNKMARKNGTMVNIASELMSLKPGDKIYIKDETNTQVKKRQVWRVIGAPRPNKNATTYGNIIDVPVTYAVRPLNVTSVLRDDIAGDSSLTVALERFSPEE